MKLKFNSPVRCSVCPWKGKFGETIHREEKSEDQGKDLCPSCLSSIRKIERITLPLKEAITVAETDNDWEYCKVLVAAASHYLKIRKWLVAYSQCDRPENELILVGQILKKMPAYGEK